MKLCKRCSVEKPLEEFSKNKAKKDGLQSSCKLCVKGINHRYYKKSPEKNVDRRASKERGRTRNRQYVLNYLLENPCVDCGETDFVVLEFDHVRGEKKNNISELVTWGSTMERLVEEIEKCEVRCCNCHRRITAKRAGWIKVLETNID